MSPEADRLPPDDSGTERLRRAAAAAQELCDVLWEELHDELRAPVQERVRELSQRLGEVSSTVAVLAAAAAAPRPGGGAAPGGQPHLSPPAQEPASPYEGYPAPAPAAPQRERRTPPQPAAAQERPSAAPAVGEQPAAHQASAPPAVNEPPAAHQPPVAHERSSASAQERPTPVPVRLVDEHERDQGPSLAPASQGPIAIHDVRRQEGPAAWVSIVGQLLDRHAVDGLPFAVLLVELVDVARMQYAETPEQLNRLIVEVEDALCRALRADDELTRESWGRYWLVAPETNGSGARMLAERVAELVRGSVTHRGVPLEVAIGIAVCPEDGVQASALAACADLGVYSARATGRPVARTEPPAPRRPSI